MANFIIRPQEIIRRRREEQASRRAALDFQRKAIATAHAFAERSAQTGCGLTFSTFANQFEYQNGDGSRMYHAVEGILNAALPQ